ncbi:MAG: hypothetical protein N4A61_02405 [Pelagimonas sp.]|jgi:hypothetical protein|nr:hypothetical protein [Pelagimonas sp.]
MPYTIFVDPEQRASFFRFYGKMTAEDGRAAFLEYLDNPLFDPTYVMMTDARQVTGISGSYVDIMYKVMGLSRQVRRFPAGAPSYILTSQDYQTGMARLLQTVLDLCSPIKVILISDIQELSEKTGVLPPEHWKTT